MYGIYISEQIQITRVAHWQLTQRDVKSLRRRAVFDLPEMRKK